MNPTAANSSCDVRIAGTGATINGISIHAAGPLSMFHAILGDSTRVVAAGTPAPVGHRNNQIHFYDHLGITLNEHHYTFQIQAVTFVFDTGDAIHPTERPFSGTLDLDGLRLVSGDSEGVLANSGIQFTSRLKGTWFATITSAPENGRPITIAIDSIGTKLPSGRRSKTRRILSVSLCLEHDPWDTQFRPRT